MVQVEVGVGMLLLLLVAPFVLLFLLLSFLCYPRPSRIPFKNRHVLITGGSSGIGLELAKLAASDGAFVSLLARDPHRLALAQRSISQATGTTAQVFSADVTDFQSVAAVAQQAGPVDILICCHGVSVPKSFEDLSMAEADHMLDTNLRGTMHVIKAMLPSLKNRSDPHPASIAIFSSQAGQVGLYGYTAYAASKFGLKGMSEALQQELLCHNIRISIIYPPDTYTPGYLTENKTKPEITKELSSSSSALEAVDVAKKSMNGIKAGQFCIYCNFDGLMLSIATSGMSPQPSVGLAFAEVLLAGLMRFVGLCVLWNWYKTVIKWHRGQNKAKGL